MGTVTILGIAAGLALDAFAVAVVAGSVLPRLTARHYFRLSFHFGLFQALMPVLGWLAGSAAAAFVQSFDHWIAFGVLFVVGGKMLLKPAEERADAARGDPTRGLTLVALAVATSIDALAVGFSLGLLDATILLPAAVIGLVAAGFTLCGMKLGRRVGKILGAWVQRAGGIVLIAIGTQILVRHLAA